MATLTNTQAINLLNAVNFNTEMAVNACFAISRDNASENREVIHYVAGRVSAIEELNHVLANNCDLTIYEEVNAFNDGNNIYEEFVKVEIKGGKVTSVKFINNAYCRDGYDLTNENCKDNQDHLMKLCNSYNFEGYRGSCNLLCAIMDYLM